MANISLTKENIKYIRDAFWHFFPEDTIYSADKPYISGEFNWNNRKEFINFVYRLTGVEIKSDKDFQNIKKAELAVEEMVETGEEKTEGNTQTKEQREQAEKIRQERQASEKEAKEGSEKSVEKSVEKQEELAKAAREKKAVQEAKEKIKATITKEQEIQETLRDKKIYAKVEISKAVPPPDESTLTFIKEAKTHPASFQKDLAENIKAKITPSLSTKLTEAEIDILAQKTAFDTVFAINNFPAQSAANTQTAILGALAKESQLLPKIIDSKDAIQVLQKSSDELSYFKNSTQLSKNILSSINENLATTVFGVGPENLNVTFFEKPVEGYTHEVDFGQLNEGHINLLGSEMKVFDNVGSFAGGEARNYLMGHARTFLDSQITKLPADSAVTGFYNSKLGQQVLSFAGLGKASPLGKGFIQSFVQRIPGSSTFFEGLGNTFGVDFGISMAVPTAEIAGTTVLATEGAVLVEGVALAEGAALTGGVVAGEIGTGIAAAGGAVIGVETQAVKKVAGGIVKKGLMAVAAKLGLSSTITVIGQALGSFAPIVGNAIAFAATWLIGKIAKKINWAKVKEWGGAIIGGVAGLIALPFLGIGAAVGIGLGATAVSAGLGAGIGGLTLGGIGAGIAGFFGALGGAFLGAVAMPILITLLAFPVVVALILFIINSGAYIVPPQTGTRAVGVGCSTQVADRAKVINNNLQRGFNNYYNKSPDYPELWNATLFARNPNPPNQQTIIDADDMFWCNYMVTKSFLAIDETVPFSLSAMVSYFQGQGRWVSGEVTTYQAVCPGDAVFFRIPATSSGLAHVAIVYSVSSDGVTTVESNAPYKTMFYPVDGSGHFQIIGSGSSTIKIAGFGAP